MSKQRNIHTTSNGKKYKIAHIYWNSKISLNESEGFYFYSIGVQYTIYFLEECFFQVLCSYETENLAHMSDKYDGTD